MAGSASHESGAPRGRSLDRMPTNTAPPRSFARTFGAALAGVVLAAGGLLIASPAYAHDELVSSDPAADAAVDALPAELTLTFSGELATDPGATELQVTDAAGTDLADGDPVVEGAVVTQALAGEASGAVTVLWKVVSSDGHPISGELAFTVAAVSTPTPTPTDTAIAPPVETPTEEPTPTPIETAAPVDAGAAAVPWILLAVLGVAVLGGITYLLVSRARRQKALEHPPVAGPEGGDGGAPPTDSAGPDSASPTDSPPPGDR